MAAYIYSWVLKAGIILGYGLIFYNLSGIDYKPELPILQDQLVNKDSVIYKTGNLIIRRLSPHVYEHTSWLRTNDFGKIECNGMLVINENEVIIFDTPANAEGSEELIHYLHKINYRINAVIPTHFHEDCVGGLASFAQYEIPGYASDRTIDILKQKGNGLSRKLIAFHDTLALKVGSKKVYAAFFGEGHTKDNIIGYFPDDKAVFGGCLIKETGANKGNLSDANVIDWPVTVTKIRHKFPAAEIVIPGHGKWGGTELFDYTIALFK